MSASLDIYGLDVFHEVDSAITSWQPSLFKRQHSIGIDTLLEQFKDEIIDPMITKLKEEGEKTLLWGIEQRVMGAKSLVASALCEKEDRCTRKLKEMEENNLAREKKMARLTAVRSNLWAAEGALTELSVRLNGWQTQRGP